MSITRTVPSAVMEWVNWSGSQRCTPARFVAPRARARSSRRPIVEGPAPVRVAGAGHSFSGGVATEGTLISLDHLARVLDADAATRPRPRRGRHPPAGSSRASCTRAGWRCPTSATSTPSRSPARSPPARTAPARASRTSPAQVESVELILADGSERTIGDGDELRAARVSLGALGVIAAVTIRCVPAFRLRIVDRPEPLDDGPRRACRSAPTRTTTSSSGRSRTRTSALVRTLDETERSAARPGRARAYASDVLMDNHAFRAVSEVAKRFPSQIPRLNRFMSAVASQRERVDWSYGIFASAAARALRGDGVRAPARARGRGRARRQGRARAPPGELPDRVALQRRRRRAALTRARAASRRSSPCTCSARWPTRRRSATSRRRWASSAGARTGASARSSPRPSSRRATRAGTPSRPSASELDPEGRFANAWVRNVLG